MKCTKCGYEACMTEFTRVRCRGYCSTGTHLRQCPECQEVSPCNPLIEELWEEKNNIKRPDDQEGFDFFEL